MDLCTSDGRNVSIFRSSTPKAFYAPPQPTVLKGQIIRSQVSQSRKVSQPAGVVLESIKASREHAW